MVLYISNPKILLEMSRNNEFSMWQDTGSTWKIKIFSIHQQQISKERDHGHIPTHDSLWENKISRKTPKDGNERSLQCGKRTGREPGPMRMLVSSYAWSNHTWPEHGKHGSCGPGPSPPFPLPCWKLLDYIPKASYQDLFPYMTTSSCWGPAIQVLKSNNKKPPSVCPN